MSIKPEYEPIMEAAKSGTLHPMHIHAHKDGAGFTVHSVGSKVHKAIKKGTKVSSSDLDDFSQSGYKVKETKKPK